MTYSEIETIFANEKISINFLEEFYWGDKKICPYCNSEHFSERKEDKNNTKRYHCNNCNTDYTVLVNTIFQNTKLSLSKWFSAIYIVCKSSKKISARHLAKEIHVTKDTALRMIKSIREFKSKNNFILKIEEMRG